MTPLCSFGILHCSIAAYFESGMCFAGQTLWESSCTGQHNTATQHTACHSGDKAIQPNRIQTLYPETNVLLLRGRDCKLQWRTSVDARAVRVCSLQLHFSYISVTSSMHEQWFLGENTSYTFVLPLISAVNFLFGSGHWFGNGIERKTFFFVPLIVAVLAVRNFCFRRYTVNWSIWKATPKKYFFLHFLLDSQECASLFTPAFLWLAHSHMHVEMNTGDGENRSEVYAIPLLVSRRIVWAETLSLTAKLLVPPKCRSVSRRGPICLTGNKGLL